MSEKSIKTAKGKKQGFFISGKMDITFFCLVMGLLVTGLVMLFSASAPYSAAYYGNSYHYIIRQLGFAVGGVIAMLFISRIDYHVLKKYAWLIFGAAFLLLAYVLVAPEVVPGFKRWIGVGPITFQPSEIAKFAVIVLFSALISKNYKRMKELKFVLELLAFLLLFCAMIFFEHHLSATILVALIGFVLLFIGGLKTRYLVITGIAAAGCIVIAVASGVIEYAGSRLTYWLDPWADMTGKGYQTIQSLLAIGSGGIMGQGIGESNQKYLWVPEPQNDFIFSIVCEELGLIGAILIVIAFALLVWRGFVIAMRAPDKFGSLLVIGLVFQVGLQTVLNMLVVTNTIPNTGISLPFFSYGGTALLMLLGQMGVIMSVSRSCNMKKV